MAPLLAADALTAELAVHGLHFVIGTEPAPATPRLTPAELLAALAQQRDARLRAALIALLLDQPALADAVSAALALLDGPAQQTLMLYYTAAVILQGKYAARLRALAPEWRPLPDRFAAALDLPVEQNPDVRLAQLGQRQREITGLAANWVGTYENTAQRFLRRREKEARWAAKTCDMEIAPTVGVGGFHTAGRDQSRTCASQQRAIWKSHPPKTMPNLETHLVLNRYCHALLGAAEFASLKNLLRPLPEGPDGSGQSHYFARLATQPGLRVPVERLMMGEGV